MLSVCVYCLQTTVTYKLVRMKEPLFKAACLYLLPADNSHIETTQNESSVFYFFLLLRKLRFCIMFHKKNQKI